MVLSVVSGSGGQGGCGVADVDAPVRVGQELGDAVRGEVECGDVRGGDREDPVAGLAGDLDRGHDGSPSSPYARRICAVVYSSSCSIACRCVAASKRYVRLSE